MKLSDDLEDEIEAVLAEPPSPAAEPGRVTDNGVGRERYLRASGRRRRGLARRDDASSSTARTARRRGSRRRSFDGWAPWCTDLRPARRRQHQRRVRRAASGGRRRRGRPPGRGRGRGATTATPTGRCSPTRAGNVIDGDQVLAACAIAMHERRRAPRRPGGHHGDGEPRVPSGDARGRHQGGRDAGRRPLRAGGDAP